jgi:hypothetical protein
LLRIAIINNDLQTANSFGFGTPFVELLSGGSVLAKLLPVESADAWNESPAQLYN